jgi:hypothetical protein
MGVVSDMVCHMYETGRGDTTDNFFTSCELADFLLAKNVTLVGTVLKGINLKSQHYFSVENKEASFLLPWVLPVTCHWCCIYQQGTRLSSCFNHSVIRTNA